jgi:hypothetical protein
VSLARRLAKVEARRGALASRRRGCADLLGIATDDELEELERLGLRREDRGLSGADRAGATEATERVLAALGRRGGRA